MKRTMRAFINLGNQQPFFVLCLLISGVGTAIAQQPPYDVAPEIKPPYYRVRYEASSEQGKLDLPVKFAAWIPPNVKTLRGVVVHQHGCGEGSCKSGLTGAFDLHWQALAAKHDCALLAASYEQPQDADCQRWCDPRNGSHATFQKALGDLATVSGHSELSEVPWALWGHSGGAYWSGIMTLLHPDRVAAAWLRSGVPLVTPRPDRPSAKVVDLPKKALTVPIMLNLGTEEGVTVKDGRFSTLWPAVRRFFQPIRRTGSPISIAIDPLTGHQCGNQRYLAIPWFDACLSERLPQQQGGSLRPMKTNHTWFAKLLDAREDGIEGHATRAFSRADFGGDELESIWLPNERIARSWTQYVKDTRIDDDTPPPPAKNVQVSSGVLTWEATADLESGIGHFIIRRDGNVIATVPEHPKNRFGRPLFQGLQYSDTPTQPLVKMQFKDTEATNGVEHIYQVISVNTVGLQSE